MFHASARDGRGALTSGGTESIMMAMLACRNWARAKGIRKPEMCVSHARLHSANTQA
jgi:glutamate/tyrosine decarboxylase-like PLP-dependent enzyme